MDTPASTIVRRAVREGHPYQPGTTIEEARRKFGLDRIIKLSSNENPLGTSPRALRALAGLDHLNVYVDNDYHELRAKFAHGVGVEIENVIVGHGSNELLALAFATFVEAGDAVIMGKPTFSLFPENARMRDAELVQVPLKDGVHDLEAMLAAVNERTKMAIICDPNNPTATCVDPDDMERFVAKLPERLLLVVDQAYREFMPPRSVDGIALAQRRQNTLVYRTMSKAHGLAAMRIGFGVGPADVIAYMQGARLPFNVALPAVVAALAALDDHDFVVRTQRNNIEGRTFLNDAFRRLGLFAYPSAANFIAVRVPVGSDEAYLALMHRGIAVRSGDPVGMPGFLRISIGTPQENAALVAALEELVPQWNAPAGRVAEGGSR